MAKPKQPRKEVVSFRLEPKIKYLVDIAARVQRRSPTNYIEYVLEESLKNVEIEKGKSIYDAAQDLWATDEPLRLVKLIINHPNLLTFEEEKISEVLRNYKFDSNNKSDEFSGYDINTIIEDWEIIKDAANGDKRASLWVIERCDAQVLTIWDLAKYGSYQEDIILDTVSSIINGSYKPETIKDSKIKDTIKTCIHNFLIDDSKEITMDNIDKNLLIESWNLIDMSPFASFIRNMLENKESIVLFVKSRQKMREEEK